MNSEKLCMEFKLLSEEFDSLGIPKLNAVINVSEFLQSFVNSARELVRIYKMSLEKYNDLELSKTQMEQELEKLRKNMYASKNDVEDKDHDLKNLENIIMTSKEEISKLESENKDVRKDKEALKKMLKSKEEQHKHVINKMDKEIVHLREKSRLEIGKYVNKDYTSVEIINRHKLREQIYKQTIEQLNNNNRTLLEEIENMQSKVIENMSSKESSL